MKTRKELVAEYKRLGNELREHHMPTQFFNHCFWRIANDYAVGKQWDTIIRRPFFEHASQQTIEKSIVMLNSMFDEQYLEHLNQISLRLRGHQHKPTTINK